MSSTQPSLLYRSDTLFGVCEAIGQDFGFNANYLRIAFAAPLLFSPAAAFAAYALAGAIVLLSRYAFPNPGMIDSADRQGADAEAPAHMEADRLDRSAARGNDNAVLAQAA